MQLRGPYEGKYRPLTDFLELAGDPVLPMTFDQIEEVLGFKLPASARAHQAWWANQERGQSLSWNRAGFRTSSVSVDEGRLTFVRFDVDDENEHIYAPPPKPLTIAEAKSRLAFTFGIEPTQIDITIRA